MFCTLLYLCSLETTQILNESLFWRKGTKNIAVLRRLKVKHENWFYQLIGHHKEIGKADISLILYINFLLIYLHSALKGVFATN